MQSPVISVPLKQTNEVDWVTPIKTYISQKYGDDPEKYNEECATLNRLRQDMRGAGKDNASGRDLLYRYYGQLELLDLRFPVDETHIKILFTWFDAFTHKPTAQHSLAFEKASVIFNIAAVLSCLAATQNRHDVTGLKTAYHSFQASAGMFTYINENFLHAPSTDLNHDTVRTLIAIMLAQAQEVFLEKQTSDGKKHMFLAKLASQAAYMYGQAVEGVQDQVNKAVFERVWLLLVQFKAAHLSSVAQHLQSLAESDVNPGVAIARLHAAEKHSKEATRLANSIPSTLPANSNLGSETGPNMLETAKIQLVSVQEKLAEFIKDNDFIYHRPVPAATSPVGKLAAAKAISVSELYQDQVHRIIGPDIFQKIVPISVTESASLYDEEKAKVLRAEAEKVEIADSEMEASLDYLKLPESLKILQGLDHDVDADFQHWCNELAGHSWQLNELVAAREKVIDILRQCEKQLDMEESVCEKMRSKYGKGWTQQPSSRLTYSLRSDIKNYSNAIEEASNSDSQLRATQRQYESDFDEMRSAGEANEAHVLYERAMNKAGARKVEHLLDLDDSSVADQIQKVEALMQKLDLIKRERGQVLLDLKEKVHTDDISQQILHHKNQELLFQTELEKFRPLQTRLLQAHHKQSSVMKELTRVYSTLLQDNRVRAEQSRYEAYARQRSSVLARYQKVYQAFKNLNAGLDRAQAFYSEMKVTADNLLQNVVTFVNNRKAEGGELLARIERQQGRDVSELMTRMAIQPQPEHPPRDPSRDPWTGASGWR